MDQNAIRSHSGNNVTGDGPRIVDTGILLRDAHIDCDSDLRLVIQRSGESTDGAGVVYLRQRAGLIPDRPRRQP